MFVVCESDMEDLNFRSYAVFISEERAYNTFYTILKFFKFFVIFINKEVTADQSFSANSM